eukprot:EG_transcript_46037
MSRPSPHQPTLTGVVHLHCSKLGSNADCPSLAELGAAASALPPVSQLGPLRFRHLTGCVRALHRLPENAGAVFQVASQFNCLEMVGPSVRPEDGVARYAADPTQGPACALCCPAATVFRNYFVQGRGQAG